MCDGHPFASKSRHCEFAHEKAAKPEGSAATRLSEQVDDRVQDRDERRCVGGGAGGREALDEDAE